ncbi:MAG: hypothetical protein AAB336_10705 [Acidobacteriota bacterium]
MSLYGITISGNSHIKDPEFTEKIEKALKLLDSKSNSHLLTVKTYTKIIRAAAASGANYNEKEMTIDIAKSTFDASLEWLASVLVHENNHLKLYKDTGKKYGDAHKMSDKKAALQVMINEELACNRIQCEALRNVGGTEHEINYLKGQKGDHFDVNKDGKYDSADYGSRNW